MKELIMKNLFKNLLYFLFVNLLWQLS